ncbi:kinase-like domain-containing protein [Dactylonectria macrodidyma]|uniref:Kinase-like domain-containing protein n=1 Tax=Dactylonectria macrodidyma TaxID=307937 RepID=A0A9P9EVU3_9HYPO|nr:kinase-like domain-containing protein [Dactylonectria macrodidyma]
MSLEARNIAEGSLGTALDAQNERNSKAIGGDNNADLPVAIEPRPSVAPSTYSKSVKVFDYGLSMLFRRERRNSSTRPSDNVPGSMDKILQEPLPEEVEPTSMKSLLLAATVYGLEGKCCLWLPASELYNICSRANVLSELKTIFPSGDADRYADYVCGSSDDRKPDAELGQRIFAILVTISELSTLPCFVKAGLRDKHLPFLSTDRSFQHLYSPSPEFQGRKEPLLCFAKKTTFYKRNFYQNQWWLNAPFISRDSDNEVKEYQLQMATAMPWTSWGTPIKSGFSEVCRVEIHEGNHTFHTHKAFAFKTLSRINSKQAGMDFRAELYVFMKMRPHRHLLELCATFKFEDREHGTAADLYAFLFPWADGGSLTNLWSKSPSAMVPNRTVTPRVLLFWIAKQCHGLVTALDSLHDIHRSASQRANVTRIERMKTTENYGIHGDIKPANILHFSQISDPTGMGILKIADFGLTDFHTSPSRTKLVDDKTLMAALAYRAPELILPDGYYSRKVDIWALGCVFSQFMTWAIKDVGSVKKFATARSKEKEDTFFKTKKWFDDLRAKVRSSEGENFATEFLTLIQQDMLEVLRTKRIASDKLAKKLAAFLSKQSDQPDDPYWNCPLPSFRSKVQENACCILI